VRVFGAASANDGNGQAHHLTGSMRRMLSFIVAAGPSGVTTDRALTELAAGDGSAKASSRLRMDISRLRKRVGPELLPTSSGKWQLDAQPYEVDYFALIESPNNPLPDRPSQLLALLSGQAFSEAPATPLVDEAKRNTLVLRQALLTRACDERPDLIDPQVLLAARSWIDDDPLNEELVSFVIRGHLHVGEVAAARELLAHCLGQFAELLHDVTPHFATEFEDELGKVRPGVSGLGEPEAPRPRILGLNEAPRIVGREEEEAQLTTWLENPDGRPMLLEGVSGTGKTALLGVVAHEAAAQGQVVVWGSAREFDTTPYATFRRALGPELDQHLNETPPPEESATWKFTLALLREKTPDALLIVDDVQWLDSLSRQLLYFLLRSKDHGLRILLSGRVALNPDGWGAIRRRALGANSEVLELRGLDKDGVEALVRDLRPDASVTAQMRLAATVHELSRGLPAIAQHLIRDADDQMTRVATSSQAHSLEWFINDLSKEAKLVGQAAAVLADPLTYPSLSALVDLPDYDLLDALEELTDRGVLQADRVPGYMSFVHALIRDAFLHGAPDEELNGLHRRAADVVDDIHRKAVHQLFSMKRGEEGDVAHALVVSGDAFYDGGSLTEAVWAYSCADELDAIDIPTLSLIRWAAAADRSRIDARPTRQRAFDSAMAEGSLDLAVEAALSGLPEAEDANGDPERLRLLIEIDADLLTGRSVFEHSATVARQLVLCGKADQAHGWVDKALAAAETDDDLDEITRTKWMASFSSTTAQQRLASPEFSAAFSSKSAKPAHLLRAIDALAAGDLARAREAHDWIAAHRGPDARPVDLWHHTMFASTIEAAGGDFSRAAELSDEAMRFGTSYGIREATSAWIAQSFIRTWMISGPEALIAELGDQPSVEVSDSFLAQASIALALFRAGMVDEARTMATAITSDALRHHSFVGVAILALCARVLGHDAPESKAIYEFLGPLSGSILVIGGGFACLGPIDLSLASVTSGVERAEHFDRARAIVSSEGLDGLRIASEREIAAIENTL